MANNVTVNSNSIIGVISLIGYASVFWPPDHRLFGLCPIILGLLRLDLSRDEHGTSTYGSMAEIDKVSVSHAINGKFR